MMTKYFEHTYLVNLPQHTGRKLKTLEHLEFYGIYPEVFEASNGYASPLLNKYQEYSNKPIGKLDYFSDFNELEFNRNKHFIETAGAYGYIDTYINILKDAKIKGYESILIFEDDVLLSKDFNKRFDNLYKTLKDNWKFIGLGASQYHWNSVDLSQAEKKGYYSPKQLDTCGSFAIAIHKEIFDELIELQQKFEAPFDHLPLGEIYNKYPDECFIAYPYMVMPDVRNSSIRGSRNQLIHAKKMKWDPELFQYPLKRPRLNLILDAKEHLKYFRSFSDEFTLPFELHIFIQSLDGLRPFHSHSQSFEVKGKDENIVNPNDGLCVKPFSVNTTITEESLTSLYESLNSNQKPSNDFISLDIAPKVVDADRVSVIIPTYKRSDNLKNVILSVIEQDYENKEIIVVDDNPIESVDQLNTSNVVKELIDEYPETTLIYIPQTKNRNGAAARNTGFLISTGNYVCFLDDDDMYLPGRLSFSIEKLKSTSDHIGAVYCGFKGWNGATKSKSRYKEGNLTLELLTLDYLSHYLHTNTATYKRDAVITLNCFDESFLRHQDIEFNLRFFEYYNMKVVKKPLIHLRPKPTKTNNQQFGSDLFDTKIKFLKKFEYIINRFDAATQKRIYEEHWTEVINYIPNDHQFQKSLSLDYSNGHVQCLLKILEKQKVEDLIKLKKNKI